MKHAGENFTVKVINRDGGRLLAHRVNQDWATALSLLNAMGDRHDVIGSIIDERTNLVVLKVNPTGLVFDENRKVFSREVE